MPDKPLVGAGLFLVLSVFFVFLGTQGDSGMYAIAAATFVFAVLLYLGRVLFRGRRAAGKRAGVEEAPGSQSTERPTPESTRAASSTPARPS